MSEVFPINADPRFRISTAVGGETTASVPFIFQDNDDIALVKYAVDGSEVNWTEGVHYSLTGAGNPAGGTATFVTPLVAGEKILRAGRAIIDRVTSVVRGGKFSSLALDNDLDRWIIIAMELARDIGQSYRAPLGSAAGMIYPDQEGRLLAFDADGNLRGVNGLVARWRGAWNALASYEFGDVAESGGSLWMARRANSGVSPVDGLDWGLFLPGGSVGDGAVGPAKLEPGKQLEFSTALGTVLYGAAQALTSGQKIVARTNLDLEPSLWPAFELAAGPAGTITVLWTGQSNAVGRAVGGPAKFLDGVLVWNNKNDLPLDLNTDPPDTDVGNAFVAPSLNADPFVNGRNNAAIHFANHLRRLTGKTIRLIIVARGSTGLLHWCSTVGVRGKMHLRIQAVLAAAGITDPVDIMGVQQGETDDGQDIVNTWDEKWAGLVANLESDGIITSSTPILLGECRQAATAVGNANGNINNALRTAVAGDARLGFANIGFFAGQIDDADPHFRGADSDELGWRFIEALSSLAPFSTLLTPSSTIEQAATVSRDADDAIQVLDPHDARYGSRRPGFLARNAADQTGIANNTSTKLLADTVLRDPMLYYNPVTSEWTPPPGLAELWCGFNATGITPGGTVDLDLYADGVRLYRSTFVADGGAGTCGATAKWLVMGDGRTRFWVQMSAPTGDTITARLTDQFGGLGGYVL